MVALNGFVMSCNIKKWLLSTEIPCIKDVNGSLQVANSGCRSVKSIGTHVEDHHGLF